MQPLEHSTDENGPLYFIGDVEFSAETGLPTGRQKFSVPTYLVASDEASIIIEYNGHRLTDIGTWNDHYGFGTSPITALEEASETLEKLSGLNADVCLVVTLKSRLCVAADKPPFYKGSQRVHGIPWSWRMEADVEREKEQEFLVWQNGQRTLQAVEFYDEVMRLSGADAAPARNGPLLTISTRKRSTSRADFLRSANT